MNHVMGWRIPSRHISHRRVAVMSMPVEAPHNREPVKGTWNSVRTFMFVGDMTCTHGESNELGPDLLEISARALWRPKAGALDVIHPMLACEPSAI